MTEPVVLIDADPLDCNWISELHRRRITPPLPPSATTVAQARALLRVIGVDLAYDPNQPRRSDGKWGGGGFGPANTGRPAGQLAPQTDLDALPEAARDAIYARAKELGPGFPQTPEAMAEIMLANFRKATPDQVRDGMAWYQGAHDIVSTATAKYPGITEDQAVAVMAVCSPRTRWPKNVQQFEAILKVHHDDGSVTIDADTFKGLKNKAGVPGPGTYRVRDLSGDQLSFVHPELKAVRNLPFGEHADQAFRALRGEPVNDVVSGIKIRNFYNNIRRPEDARSATFDAWAVRGMVKPGVRLPVPRYTKDAAGNKVRVPYTMSENADTQTYFTKPNAKKAGLEEGTGMYPFFGSAAQIAAREAGVLPQQMQAVTWLVVQEGGGDDE